MSGTGSNEEPVSGSTKLDTIHQHENIKFIHWAKLMNRETDDQAEERLKEDAEHLKRYMENDFFNKGELRYLKYLAKGVYDTNKKISAAMNLSVKTVEKRVTEINSKLGWPNSRRPRIQAALNAIKDLEPKNPIERLLEKSSNSEGYAMTKDHRYLRYKLDYDLVRTYLKIGILVGELIRAKQENNNSKEKKTVGHLLTLCRLHGIEKFNTNNRLDFVPWILDIEEKDMFLGCLVYLGLGTHMAVSIKEEKDEMYIETENFLKSKIDSIVLSEDDISKYLSGLIPEIKGEKPRLEEIHPISTGYTITFLENLVR